VAPVFFGPPCRHAIEDEEWLKGQPEFTSVLTGALKLQVMDFGSKGG